MSCAVATRDVILAVPFQRVNPHSRFIRNSAEDGRWEAGGGSLAHLAAPADHPRRSACRAHLSLGRRAHGVRPHGGPHVCARTAHGIAPPRPRHRPVSDTIKMNTWDCGGNPGPKLVWPSNRLPYNSPTSGRCP